MLILFLLFAWLAGMVYASIPFYWFLIHPFSEHWQQWKKSPFRLLLPLWFLVIVVACAATWRWHAQSLYAPNVASSAIAVALFVCGLLVYRRIGRFGVARFAGLAEVRPLEHEQLLVTSGMHARVRHPIYLAHLCMFLTWTLSSGLAILYFLSPAVLVLATVMIRLEERELQRRFGEAYRKYSECTPAILPFRLFPG